MLKLGHFKGNLFFACETEEQFDKSFFLTCPHARWMDALKELLVPVDTSLDGESETDGGSIGGSMGGPKISEC